MLTESVIKRKSTGRPELPAEVVNDFRARVEQNSQTSSPKLSAESGAPYSTVLQGFYDTSAFNCRSPRRVEYCNWFQKIDDDRLLDLTFVSSGVWLDSNRLLDLRVFSNEARLYLSGYSS